jgi:DNA-binding response OmpR family regulator
MQAVIETARAKVLVVDDEDHIRVLMGDVLESAGYQVRHAADGQGALREVFAWKPDLVVMDIRMPGMDGWTLLERIREVSQTPTIVLSALAQEQDLVRGLHAGADDYVVKPPRMSEFLARVEATLRRAGEETNDDDQYDDGTIHVDFSRHMVVLRGTTVDLSPQEFRLLATLIRHQGVVLSADRLLGLCWRDGYVGLEAVRVYIGYLRKKLEDDAKRPQLIETVREFGYRYRAPVN